MQRVEHTKRGASVVPTDRGLRDHRRPPHGRARRQERLDRLHVVPEVRLADDLRRAARRRAGRPVHASGRSSPTARRSRCTCRTRTSCSPGSSPTRASPRSPTSCRSASFPHDHPRVLVRRVKTVRGALRFNVVFEPRFDYGRADHSVEEREHECIFTSKGADGTAVRLRTAVPMTISGERRGGRDVRAARGRERRVHHGGGGRGHAQPVGRARLRDPARSRTPRTSGATGSAGRSTRAGGARR